MPVPDSWIVLTARIGADDPLRDLTVEGLLAAGGLSVIEEDGTLTTYLEANTEPAEQVASVERLLADWLADDPPELVWRLQPNEDWEREWRRGLQPRKVSHRIVVSPSWADWTATADEVVVRIDPQMAFGTGEHATTRGCLQLLDPRLIGGERVLDIGSGSAILSIAAALLGAREVVAIELDPDANINARENIVANGVAGSVDLCEALADPPLLATLGTFDVILANILSGVIIPLLPALASSLAPAGSLIVSGILRAESQSVVEAAVVAGFTLETTLEEEEWWTGLLGRVKNGG